MTQNLYHLDAYLKQFDAEVTAIEPEIHAIALNRTTFYPGGGGQPNDTGWLIVNNNRLEIIKVKKINNENWHFIDQKLPLPEPGSKVNGEIDWQRRYQLMRTHSAMHVLCGVVFRDFGALVTGGNMEPLEGRMDFEFETMSKDLVEVIENAVNKEIEAGHPIVANDFTA